MQEIERRPPLKGSEWIVSEFSTRRNQLPLDEITLIGIAGRPGELTAIIRVATGGIISAQAGQSTDAGDLVAVLEDNVLLSRQDGFLSLYLSGIS